MAAPFNGMGVNRCAARLGRFGPARLRYETLECFRPPSRAGMLRRRELCGLDGHEEQHEDHGGDRQDPPRLGGNETRANSKLPLVMVLCRLGIDAHPVFSIFSSA